MEKETSTSSAYQDPDISYTERNEGEDEEEDEINVSDNPGKDGWTCTKCNNVNFAYRDKCNMRKCRAPRVYIGSKRGSSETNDEIEKNQDPKRSKPTREGDWICKRCGNINFANRVRCNMRKCQAPREEWVCRLCKNVNYKFRTHCNMRKCKAPRPPESYPDYGYGILPLPHSSPMDHHFGSIQSIGHNQNYPQLHALLNQGHGMHPNHGMHRGHGMYRGHGMMHHGHGMMHHGHGMMHSDGYGYHHRRDEDFMYSRRHRGSNIQPRNKREGDWECRECGNINFAHRKKCNMRKCGAEKPPSKF